MKVVPALPPTSLDRARPAPWSARAVLALAAALTASCGSDAPAARPNVVLVTIDTLRQDYTSLGDARADTTPFLAALGARGTVFENAFALSSWTSPSMNMILTGEVRVENDGAILHDQVTIAQAFQRAGYRTGAFVGNPILFTEQGFDRGCDLYDIVPLEEGATNRVDDHVDGALAWLDGLDGDAPFFLWVHPMDPHDPYEAREGIELELEARPVLLDEARAALPDTAAAELTDAQWATLEAQRTRYAEEIRAVDQGLKRLWKGLEARGFGDDTVILVTADHGEGLWMRPSLVGEYQPQRPFPPLYMTHGVQLYAEQVHVPLLVAGPGVEAGRREERFVDLLGVAPTLYALADVGVGRELDGAPLVGPHGSVPEAPIFSVCARATTVTVDERWRLHVPSPDRAKRYGDVPQLFDLESDPRERTPIDDPERVAALTKRIEDWKAAERQIQDLPPNTVAYRRALRSLGYGGETARAEEYDAFLDEMEAAGFLPEDGTIPTHLDVKRYLEWKAAQEAAGGDAVPANGETGDGAPEPDGGS